MLLSIANCFFRSNHEMCQQAPYDDFDSNALVPQSTKSAFQFNKFDLIYIFFSYILIPTY